MLAVPEMNRVVSGPWHRAMARAEVPLAVADGRNVELFVFKRLLGPPRKSKDKLEPQTS